VLGLSWWHSGRRSWLWWTTAAIAYPFIVWDACTWVSLFPGWNNAGTPLGDVGMAADVTVGLLFWMWRPRNPVGPLLIAWGSLNDLIYLMLYFPDSRLAATTSMTLGYAFLPLYVAVLLLFPSGRLPNRWALAFIVWWLSLSVVINLPAQLFGSWFPFPGAHSYLYLGHGWSDVRAFEVATWWAWIASYPVLDTLLLVRLRRAVPGARRRLVPLFLVMLIGQTTTGEAFAFDFLRQQGTSQWVNWTFSLMPAFSAAGAAYGLAAVRRKRSTVADLVVELERAEPGRVRESLARAVGDPTLQLGLWLPERQAWVGDDGSEFALPADNSRGVTYLGDRLAVVVHDRDLLDQPRLLEAAGSAARLALENERLQADLRADVAEVHASRARIIDSADTARRRLERDIRDGAREQLLHLRAGLHRLAGHLDAEGQSLLTETHEELRLALAELRDLARGIHPAILSEHGLDAAIRSLAERAPVPVTVNGCGERLPEPVETAAYFVVSEALTNITKYAHATHAWVSLERENGHAHVEVGDDGIGGANPTTGSGLRGLNDRVAALDGRLTIDSPPGGGTTIRAAIPCPA